MTIMREPTETRIEVSSSFQVLKDAEESRTLFHFVIGEDSIQEDLDFTLIIGRTISM